MKFTKSLLIAALALSVAATSCKPKDADVKANVENTMKDNADAANVQVSVVDGVATLSGEVKDAETQAALEAAAKDAKGVKSVVNNTTVMMVSAPIIAADDPLMAGVTDATKDFPTVTATVNDGVITLNGTIEKSKLPMLMQTLMGLNPKNIENNLTQD